MDRRARPPHTLLPPEAIAALQKAARMDVPPDDPLAKAKAIEHVTRHIRQQHPNAFKE